MMASPGPIMVVYPAADAGICKFIGVGRASSGADEASNGSSPAFVHVGKTGFPLIYEGGEVGMYRFRGPAQTGRI
jgi:hypothetical protein